MEVDSCPCADSAMFASNDEMLFNILPCFPFVVGTYVSMMYI